MLPKDGGHGQAEDDDSNMRKTRERQEKRPEPFMVRSVEFGTRATKRRLLQVARLCGVFGKHGAVGFSNSQKRKSERMHKGDKY